MIENYVVVDLEMTGMNLKKDHIIEIGALRVQGDQIDTFSTLIDPGVSIPQKIQELTGITDEMAAGGRNDVEAMEEFFAFVKGLPLVGHRIMGDYEFIKQWAVNHNIKYECSGIDTLQIARKYLPTEQKKSLDCLCDYYEIGMEHHHRALDDAQATYELLQRLWEQFGEEEAAAFEPKPLLCKVKKIRPATSRQKKFLQELMTYHQIEDTICWEQLSQSEASRMTDRIISAKGRPSV